MRRRLFKSTVLLCHLRCKHQHCRGFKIVPWNLIWNLTFLLFLFFWFPFACWITYGSYLSEFYKNRLVSACLDKQSHFLQDSQVCVHIIWLHNRIQDIFTISSLWLFLLLHIYFYIHQSQFTIFSWDINPSVPYFSRNSSICIMFSST